MEDYMYIVETEKGKMYAKSLKDAMLYYNMLDGISIYAQTKDLFPTIINVIDKPNIDTERIRGDLSLKKTSKAQRKAILKYDDINTKQYKIKLNKTTDADIIEYLEKLDNKQGFLKELIRNQIVQK